MIKVKSFVRPDDTATITCPSCQKTKNVTVTQFRNKKHTLKINCPCKTPFIVDLDFRHHYRKEIDLPGTYRIIKPPGTGNGAAQIQNISLTGVGFTVSGITRLEKGQIAELNFQLDDSKQTRMISQVRICLIRDNYIGCEFSDKDLYEKDLGFYLRF